MEARHQYLFGGRRSWLPRSSRRAAHHSRNCPAGVAGVPPARLALGPGAVHLGILGRTLDAIPA